MSRRVRALQDTAGAVLAGPSQSGAIEDYPHPPPGRVRRCVAARHRSTAITAVLDVMPDAASRAEQAGSVSRADRSRSPGCAAPCEATSPPYPHRHARRRGGRAMSDMSRNEYLRGAMAAGAASFAESLTGERASVDGSATAQALDHVQRLVDAASDRLTGALADAGQLESAVVTAPPKLPPPARC